MNPLGVVVGHVVSEQTPEMTFAEDDHVVEKLSPTGSYPPLGNRVLPGAAVGRAHGMDPKAPDRSRDLCGEDRVAVEEEVARSTVGRKGRAKLLNDPCGGRVCRHIRVEDSAN